MMRSIQDPRALERLEARLLALKSTTPRRWGTLTPGEALCHLSDAMISVRARPGGPSVPARPLRKWLALRSGLPWPHGVPTLPHVDPRRDGTRPADFASDRERVIIGLRELATLAPDALPTSHKLFGSMTRDDWCRWAYCHTDHHLRQFGV